MVNVRFLEKLFPAGRFVMLRGDICEVAVSAILASWSLRWFWDYRETMPLEMAEAIVRDVTYAVLAIESGLDAMQAQLGPHCLQLDYSQLLDPALGFVASLFRFLELAPSEQVIGRIREVLHVRTTLSVPVKFQVRPNNKQFGTRPGVFHSAFRYKGHRRNDRAISSDLHLQAVQKTRGRQFCYTPK